ncbi:PepSY domain-containing protein [Rhodopila globiformis]|uniref:PepSY domain-containing protein n=1 Tax=Rhodopila globiformis TaxID=1071 RepID=A0A2S6NNV3_RHOGL|nr:PepSY domain-containing protein [Rhodopila globiformis]PPQ39529.1 hypothetical protein CCS01_01140 [Rhodopila globiformis]
MKSVILGVATAAILAGGPCLAETTQNGQAAASGDTNQAVATTNANAPTPARGANSFTMNEAKSRLEKQGFSNVSNLHKDHNDIWRGKAEKNGMTDSVWVDYKGNVGIAQR